MSTLDNSSSEPISLPVLFHTATFKAKLNYLELHVKGFRVYCDKDVPATK